MLLRKFGALLFLIAIALIPVVIVLLYSQLGGIWVAGYVTGIITVPVVAFGAIRSVSLLTEDGAFMGSVVFGFIVILISVAAALWSFFGPAL